MAAKFADTFDGALAARYAALLHDAGKAHPDWQAGLLRAEREDVQKRAMFLRWRRTPVGIDHKSAGAWEAAKSAGDMGPIISLAIYGHHNRLPSYSELLEKLAPADPEIVRRWMNSIEHASLAVPEIVADTGDLGPRWLYRAPEGDRVLLADLLVRMVGSAIYDADSVDTERHFQPPERPGMDEPPGLGALVGAFECNRERIVREQQSPLDGARQALSNSARDAASQVPGLFRMAYPTGAGKTISGARFAVHHAARWGHQRLIYAAPFRAVTAQTADEMRRLFGAGYVREHHSGVELDRLGGNRDRPDSRSLRRASENWDAPVIVTTTVQLFESLFSDRPTALRKVHRIAGSVLILDEVQSLPDRLLLPILSALRHLAQYYGVSVVLCSATQPAFDALSAFSGFRERNIVRDIGPAQGDHSRSFQRVRYLWRVDPKPTIAQIAAEASACEQALVILNTTKDAAAAHKAMVAEGRADALHLSTRMAAAHRGAVLSDIGGRLKRQEPVLVASTQLVEAGVDISFPSLYRAWAPAEALCQAAGRSNRHARLDDLGQVTIFDPIDGGQPPDYRTTAALTRKLFGPGLADPDDADQLRLYYRLRYKLQGVDSVGGGEAIQQARAALDFPTVARKFRMVEEYGVPVVVDYQPGTAVSAELHRLLDSLTTTDGPSATLLRAFGPWTATLPRWAATAALEDGRAERLIGDLLLWHGPYHPQRGIEQLGEPPAPSA